jgi:ribonuclease Z
VLFLGTGSAMPSKYRNVSGILLRRRGGAGILLDAGEATLNQLQGVYSHGEELCEGEDNLGCSCHQLGYPNIFIARRRSTGD